MKDLEKHIDSMDITKEAPISDPERQYYYIKKAREYVKEASLEAGRPLTFCVTTFGCQMNARDSEKLAGILELTGYLLVDDEDADFVIYNTCTVRDNANQRVYGRLGVLNGFKRSDILGQFNECENFCGLVNVVDFVTELDCDGSLDGVAEYTNTEFAKRFPAGVTANDVNYRKDREEDLEALTVISYTSGTSSAPKGVMLPAKSLSGNLRFARDYVPTLPGGNTFSILPLPRTSFSFFDNSSISFFRKDSSFSIVSTFLFLSVFSPIFFTSSGKTGTSLIFTISLR